MLIKEVLLITTSKLKTKIGNSAYLEAEIILADILKITREKLLISLETKINSKQVNRFNKLVERRLKLEPLAYIIGFKEFSGLKLKVNKNVLIPRPETEELVELVINSITSNKDKIIDLGTGSGAIALAIKNKVPKNKVIAIDNSSSALSLARLNAKNNKLKVTFLKSNLLDKVNNKDLENSILVANLPYIDKAEIKNFSNDLKKSLSYEPKNAIFARKFGTEIYEKLFLQLKKIDQKYLPKMIFIEIGSFRYKKFLKITNDILFPNEIILKKDLYNRPRFIIINLKK